VAPDDVALDDDDVAIAKSTCQHILFDMCMSSTTNVVVDIAVGQSSNEQLYGVVNNFFEEVIPTFSMDTFHSHFRMSRTAMDMGTGLDDDSMPVAKEALKFMVVGVNDSFKVPAGYFLIGDLGGTEKANLT